MWVAVFTGSSAGPTTHRLAAAAFAETLARRGVGIVYGGGRVGLMGTLADAALAAGGEVVGVMPQHLVDREIAHRSLTRLDIVADMHERKARMADLADAFVAMPGGAGTLEELFEAWTWGQLGLHEKPTALLDVNGFFAPLQQQLQVMCADGYIDRRFVESLGVADSADAFLRFVGSYSHPSRKWSTPAPAETTKRLFSVGWLAIEGQQLLAVRARGRDRFYLPGGKIEPGETNEAALRREVREELGIGSVRSGPRSPSTPMPTTYPAHGSRCTVSTRSRLARLTRGVRSSKSPGSAAMTPHVPHPPSERCWRGSRPTT